MTFSVPVMSREWASGLWSAPGRPISRDTGDGPTSTVQTFFFLPFFLLIQKDEVPLASFYVNIYLLRYSGVISRNP